MQKPVFEVARADGSIVCDSCRLADTFGRRFRGLLGRRDLAEGEGLLIRPSSSIHTFFMRFPIDVVFLDRDGVVVKRASGVKPWRVVLARGARDALELHAGEAERHAVHCGDRLELRAPAAARRQAA